MLHESFYKSYFVNLIDKGSILKKEYVFNKKYSFYKYFTFSCPALYCNISVINVLEADCLLCPLAWLAPGRDAGWPTGWSTQSNYNNFFLVNFDKFHKNTLISVSKWKNLQLRNQTLTKIKILKSSNIPF